MRQNIGVSRETIKVSFGVDGHLKLSTGMESVQKRVEEWIGQRNREGWRWSWKWPLSTRDNKKEEKQKEEYRLRRRYQLQFLCNAVKADNVEELQDILCAMVLSECVYKKPTSEVVRAVNKFKADFGGQVVSLEYVQPSLDHVPHRYLLAEAGDTLFASFIGTKQYKDVIADVNILQGAVFHEDTDRDGLFDEDATCSHEGVSHGGSWTSSKRGKPRWVKAEEQKGRPKPAAHKGFLARAKGIPALEIYRLAQKKDRRLVLCGHSLGGAVAVLATLAILRVFASSQLSKDGDEIRVKCITFSQPPVGNAALRDYVQQKGWQHHFRTYCIPEDVVPRILSPAYFQHYRSQASEGSSDGGAYRSSLRSDNCGLISEISAQTKSKPNEADHLVLGLGPVQNSFRRLSRLVPTISTHKQLNWFGRKKKVDTSLTEADPVLTSAMDERETSMQSLEIQEGVDGISLAPFSDVGKSFVEINTNTQATLGREAKSAEWVHWHRVPSLPSYVPFGELYLLGKSSIEPLSASEYTKLTSVQSVLAELRERFQSHSMKSYRSRFQKIYDLCMGNNAALGLGMEHLPNLPHLQQWLGLAVAGAVELGHIAEPVIVRTATSLVPLGWNGVPCEKNGSEPLKVDIYGYGLHFCTMIRAQVNGRWCSTIVESEAPPPPPTSSYRAEPKLQKMRIQIGGPLKQHPKQQSISDSTASDPVLGKGFTVPASNHPNQILNLQNGCSNGSENCQAEGLSEVTVHCTSDFVTVSKEVYIRLRRVRLLGVEGAGKTSLFYALLGQGKGTTSVRYEGILPDIELHEGMAGGVCFIDPAAINFQELPREVSELRHELSVGLNELRKKIDLVILVHNLSHEIPRVHQTHIDTHLRPGLSVLMDEVQAAGIPSILAMTNKFSVSADKQISAVKDVIEAYQMSPNMGVLINSRPHIVHGTGRECCVWNSSEKSLAEANGTKKKQGAVQKFISAPMNLVQLPFQKKEVILPVEGVDKLRKLVDKVLISHEESSFQELARARLSIAEAKEKMQAADALRYSQRKLNSSVSALVGASLGAGQGKGVSTKELDLQHSPIEACLEGNVLQGGDLGDEEGRGNVKTQKRNAHSPNSRLEDDQEAK
ncbi:hypothetical protein KI387_023854 [Taxus chinensis]|uniref:Fungal lipase-type domain-containing protein n=1 Tax=Taxus chinensis TaxID=29808 RepID=A0AA38G2W3_TAXCH|nr:hypothetical protein KI387_023854 [Taxus chinensis]